MDKEDLINLQALARVPQEESRQNKFFKLRTAGDKAMTDLSAVIAALKKEGHEACMSYEPGLTQGILSFKSSYKDPSSYTERAEQVLEKSNAT